LAFRDLEEGVSDLFAETHWDRIAQNDLLEGNITAWLRRKGHNLHRELRLRWSRELKVKRARQRTWVIPLLPREVSCARCRRDFANAQALRAHWYEKHIKRNQ
jgi:hypothetical protein